jgi:hydroxypyruvate reductase
MSDDRLAVEMRVTARDIFSRALADAGIDRAFERNVQCDRGVLRVCEDLYDLNSYSRVFVVSLGKAAHTMVNALEMQAGSRFEGIVAASIEPPCQLHNFRYFFGGHPTPNRESIRGAEAILKSLGTMNPASLVIFLLSGGGSSIVEKPLDDEMTLDDLVESYRALVQSGAPIAEVNAIRKHLSAVKGGRLAAAAHPAQQVSLLVSDVPDKAPDALASGPTMPDSTSIADCYAIADKYDMVENFPAPVRDIFRRRALDETPKQDDPVFHRSRWWTILCNGSLLKSARIEAERAGFQVEIDNSCDDWDYARASKYLLNRLRELRKETERACLLSGGEITVKMSNGGRGGRNQQFALACAAEISGQNITVLSAGSDGIDGNSSAAGAIVDGTTVARAKNRGLKPEAYLARFDAYSFFESLGDAVMTGPTGNNLRDLRVLLAY